MTTQAPVVVIGVGSPFGADQLGWKIIEQLKQQQSLVNDRMQLVSCDRPGTLLLEYFKGVDCAVIIDAIEGGAPGNLQVIAKTELLTQDSLQSSHQLGVAETVALGDKLNMLPSQLLLFGIETGNPETPHKLSDETFLNVTGLISKKLKNLVC